MKNTIFSIEAFAQKAREVAAEGCVLLRNENSALPLLKGTRTAVFGRTQMNYYKSGLGSGGLVNTRYVTGIYEAMQSSGDYILDMEIRSIYENWSTSHAFEIGDGWATHPWYQEEMPLDEDTVRAASERNDAAVVIIGRTAGEDRDNMKEAGSWFLTQDEENMLSLVCRHFDRSIVLLNVGNIIDMAWVEKYQPSAVMYVWQGGQEGGSGVSDVLCGRVSPCGRLTDTIAKTVEAYPSDSNFGDKVRCFYCEDIYVGYRYFETLAKDDVLYPFGEGLSYTEFEHQPLSMNWDGKTVTLSHRVKNIGSCSSKEVVQAYVRLPQGKLGKPDLTLCGFSKTKELDPGESVDIEITVPVDRFTSYDDNNYRYVLEEGTYSFFTGHSIRGLSEAGSFSLDKTIVTAQLEQACAPSMAFDRLHPVDGCAAYEPAPLRIEHPSVRRLRRLPKEIAPTDFKGLRLEDVASKKCTLEEFIAQMNDDDLCCIVRGEGMSSPRVTPGTAGAIGGVSDRLTDLFGIPTACCSDGPSGIRMDCGNKAFSLPNGTCQACTWNEELISELYAFEGLEMRKYQVDNLLGPGMNIHRHPLNGRNFEYFSEDPLLTGRMACAQLDGLHKSGVTGTIKHYACNNQETERRMVDAVVSERALREIYLKGFEIAVKEGGTRSIMTTYNPLNGCWTASHYDLVTTVLRGEWGYDGIVMSDWWAAGSEDGGEPAITKVASMVRAQNDLFMVANDPPANSGEDDCEESLREGSTTRAEFQRCAMNICRFVMNTPAFRRSIGLVSEDDAELQKMRDDDDEIILNIPEFRVDEEAVIDGSVVNTAGGQTTMLQMKIAKRGQYRISVTCRAADNAPDTAQLPMSIFVDYRLIGTHVLNGAQKQWQTVSFDTDDITRRLLFQTKFFFTVGGTQINEIRVTRIKTLE
ncbi:MAG: glycoside hydrolase family 3 protein [Clostridia bacterium]|nr:glycoside hydrolase family 3 protein [Clostridia bacterium]